MKRWGFTRFRLFQTFAFPKTRMHSSLHHHFGTKYYKYYAETSSIESYFQATPQ